MKCLLPATTANNINRIIEVYGDAAWEELCDAYWIDEPIVRSEVRLKCMRHLNQRNQDRYLGWIIRNIELQYQSDPNNCPIKRRGRTFIL